MIQNYTNEFVIEAELRLGHMLKDMNRNKGGRPQKTPTKTEGVSKEPATYKELGIKYKDAAKYQFIAVHEEEIRQTITDMWMQCYSKDEIAEMCNVGIATVNEICPEMANLPESNQAAASHATDFDIPLYDVWTQRERKPYGCLKLVVCGRSFSPPDGPILRFDRQIHHLPILNELGSPKQRKQVVISCFCRYFTQSFACPYLRQYN